MRGAFAIAAACLAVVMEAAELLSDVLEMASELCERVAES
jgi:hypothetical protein